MINYFVRNHPCIIISLLTMQCVFLSVESQSTDWYTPYTAIRWILTQEKNLSFSNQNIWREISLASAMIFLILWTNLFLQGTIPEHCPSQVKSCSEPFLKKSFILTKQIISLARSSMMTNESSQSWIGILRNNARSRKTWAFPSTFTGVLSKQRISIWQLIIKGIRRSVSGIWTTVLSIGAFRFKLLDGITSN